MIHQQQTSLHGKSQMIARRFGAWRAAGGTGCWTFGHFARNAAGLMTDAAKADKTAKPAKPARRLGREDWIAAARKILVDRGIDDVKVDRLARQMRVTRGSFYWHFQDRRELLDALLTDWEARNYFEIAQVRARSARATDGMVEVFGIWLGEDASVLLFDIAVRSWARRSAEVAASVARVDKAWIELIQEFLERDGYSGDEALVRARVTYFHQIGYWALNIDDEPLERLRLVPVYYQVLTGREPSAELMRVLKQQATRMKAPKTPKPRAKRAKATA
jgi:AcrR family transcriptional regulator